MIIVPTTLVIGAGASLPYGFPSGEKLSQKILAYLHSVISNNKTHNPTKLGTIMSNLFSNDVIEKFDSSFRNSGQLSIDSFLEYRQEFIPIGKFMIAYVLLFSEINSNFFNNNSINDHWYQYLWQLLKPNSDIGLFKNNELSIITFNYDRSFEHYFQIVIASTFGIPEIDALSLFEESIPVVHVHGQLGFLKENSGAYVSFGANCEDEKNLKLASIGIKIISEVTAEKEFEKAHKLLSESKRVYFTGFGYHSDNVRRLKFAEFIDKRYLRLNIYGKTNEEMSRCLKSSFNKSRDSFRNSSNIDFLRNIPF